MKTLLPTRSFDDVNVGDELPELVIELTPTVIVSTAIASRASPPREEGPVRCGVSAPATSIAPWWPQAKSQAF